tara:strand:- start:399 stop:563 length:165 start_codon:yes stop_codon:yes gene_type:complete
MRNSHASFSTKQGLKLLSLTKHGLGSLFLQMHGFNELISAGLSLLILFTLKMTP